MDKAVLTFLEAKEELGPDATLDDVIARASQRVCGESRNILAEIQLKALLGRS